MRDEFSNRFIYDKDEYYLLLYYFRYMLQPYHFMDTLLTMGREVDLSSEQIGYAFANNCDEEDFENGEGFEDEVLFFY